ncbi:MAG: SIMPL domain-containing protein [Candidatus Levyibacteriota bacterium]
MKFEELKTPFFTIIFIFLGLIIFTKLFGPIPFSINSVQTTKANLFNAQGTGKATAVPDTAEISLGATKTAQNVTDAQNQVNSVVNKIISDLKKLGIEEKNIQTLNYSISPNYDFNSGRQNVTGYTVTQNMEVKIKPIDKANQAIDTATADGANLVGGVTFVLDDKTQKDMENKARNDAIKDAKEKAENLAKAAGIKLGKIIDVQEGQSFEPRPILMSQGVSEKAQTIPTQLAPGENTVTSTVTLYYETY